MSAMQIGWLADLLGGCWLLAHNVAVPAAPAAFKPPPYPSEIAGVPKESFPAERRVALSPAGAAALLTAGFKAVIVEQGAGASANFADDQYTAAGAVVGSKEEAFGADVVLKIRVPGA